MSNRARSLTQRCFICMLAALLVLLQAGPPVSADDPLIGLDAYVEQVMEEWQVPGLAVAIVKDDEIVLAKGYGVREIGGNEPVDENTIFAIGSSSKAFTAASVAVLVGEGKLAWDDPLTDHLSQFQMYDPWVTREITVRDLLCHRSGLPTYGGDQLWYVFGYDPDEVLARTRYIEPESSFRSRFAYQNLMFLAAGEVIEAVSGQSWADFVHEHILTPLGMESSTTSITDLEGVENVASPHAIADGRVHKIPWHTIDNCAPAGALNSNVLDMAQWIRLQLHDGMYEGNQIVGASEIEEMHSPQTIMKNIPLGDFYGLGWFLREHEGRKVIDHGGNIDGMTAMVSLMPEENLGMVILTNMNDTRATYALESRVYDAFLGLPERDWSAVQSKHVAEHEQKLEAKRRELDEAHVEGTSPTLPPDQYAGTYVSDLYGEIEVVAEEGQLVLRFVGPAGPQVPLEHWQCDTFRLLDRGLDDALPEWVEFGVSVMGEADSLELSGMGKFTRPPDETLAH